MVIALVTLSWVSQGRTVTDEGICMGSSRTQIEAYIEAKCKMIIRSPDITTLTVEAVLFSGHDGWLLPYGELAGGVAPVNDSLDGPRTPVWGY